jgi:membrane-associated phospholipid phosphatase
MPRQPAIVRLAWIALLVLVAHLVVSTLDQGAATWARTAPGWMLATFRALTELGDSFWSLVPTGTVALLALALARLAPLRRRARAVIRWIGEASLFVFVSIALSGILVNVIKVLVGRARPKLLDLDAGLSPLSFQGDFHSFPSGHSNTAFALALALGFLAPRFRVPLLLLAGLVAASRVVVSAHFVTDIVGGAAVAVITGYWLRNAAVDRGWALARRRDGATRARWPGRLLPALARRAARRLGRLMSAALPHGGPVAGDGAPRAGSRGAAGHDSV